MSMSPTLLRALDQMERAMASEAGRLVVNAETAAARQEREAELIARRAAPKLEKTATATLPAMPAKSIQNGDYGKLD